MKSKIVLVYDHGLRKPKFLSCWGLRKDRSFFMRLSFLDGISFFMRSFTDI